MTRAHPPLAVRTAVDSQAQVPPHESSSCAQWLRACAVAREQAENWATLLLGAAHRATSLHLASQMHVAMPRDFLRARRRSQVPAVTLFPKCIQRGSIRHSLQPGPAPAPLPPGHGCTIDFLQPLQVGCTRASATIESSAPVAQPAQRIQFMPQTPVGSASKITEKGCSHIKYPNQVLPIAVQILQ